MAKYTFNDRYDIEDIYTYTDTSEERLQALDDKHIIKYRTKTIKAGDVLECEVYPIWDTRSSMSRASKARESRETQKRLNDRNATKNLIRLVNTNFTNADIWGTFTYESKKLPPNVEAAQKEMTKFMRRLKYYAVKHNFPPLKYVYVTEFENDPKKGKKRVHHHVVTNFPDRDVAEKLWKNGARTQTRRLQADDDGYEGMVRYISKDPRGAKRYVTSKNLQKPIITIADCKFTRRKVNRIVHGENDPRALFEKMYDGWQYVKSYSKTSDYVTGTYLYVKMKKIKRTGGRKYEIHRE